MGLLDELRELFTNHPLAYANFDAAQSASILDSRHGLKRFTLTQQHAPGERLGAPTLALIQFNNDVGPTASYIGILAQKQAVSTLDTRFTFQHLRKLSFSSVSGIAGKLPLRARRTKFRSVRQKKQLVTALPPKLSLSLMRLVLRQNEQKVDDALRDLPNQRPLENIVWEKNDANNLAQSIFGLSGSERLDDYAEKDDPNPARLLEDRLIEHDAVTADGYDRLRHHFTGHSEFRKNDQVLHIFNANRGLLEKSLGVDLVYINDTVCSVVMVQYKMLDTPDRREGGEWSFRPDRQLEKDLDRMRLPKLKSEPADYRLQREPFYFKFVKRKIEQATVQGFIISRAHLEKLLESELPTGPHGGVRIGYETLNGIYLREQDLIGLIRSGYIGTHAEETKMLRPFLEGFLRGDRALVLAWQTKLGTDEH